MLKRSVVELNLFKSNWTGNNDQSQIHNQRMASRLYIVLVALVLIIFTAYLFLTPQIQMQTVENPSSASFSDLHSRYNSSLQCKCSNISVPYEVFLMVKPHYHQMCRSDLVSESLLNSLAIYLELIALLFPIGSSSKVLHYAFNGGSQFFLLKVLCGEAQRTIDNSLQQFFKQTFVTTQAISENLFELQVTALIKDWKAVTINNFIHTLQLIRAIQHGNHLAAADSNSRFYVKPMLNKSLLNSSVYYDQCNCMLSKLCHSPLRVFNYKVDATRPLFEIPGFFMGCFRLEALLSSTLECFYNQTCMDKVNTNVLLFGKQSNFTALNATGNSPYESIDSVASRLFVEEWSNYSSFNSYYKACAPDLCIYEDMRRLKLMSLVTSIIGIFGSLTSGFKISFLLFLWLMIKVRLFVIIFSVKGIASRSSIQSDMI